MGESVLHEKSLLFAVRIVKFYQYLCQSTKEFVLGNQILKSGTSIGANIRESRNAQSKADFINKLGIALKEADETLYWLEVFLRTNIINQSEYDSLYNDANELISMLTASIKTAKKKQKS